MQLCSIGLVCSVDTTNLLLLAKHHEHASGHFVSKPGKIIPLQKLGCCTAKFARLSDVIGDHTDISNNISDR